MRAVNDTMAKRLVGAFMLFVGFAWSWAASAASFEVHEGEELNVIIVTDEILPEDDRPFLAAVEKARSDGSDAIVVLASPGGALGAGMHMGLIIREAGLPTFVPEGEICASACALAWLAGAPRMMTSVSEIGFHQPYDELDGVMVASIEANAVVGHYIATIGMGPEIVSFAVAAPPDEMGWLDLTTAELIGLDVTEVSISGFAKPVMTASATSPPLATVPDEPLRSSPIDENVSAVAYAPLPIMRALTPGEVNSLHSSGFVDGEFVGLSEERPSSTRTPTALTSFAPVEEDQTHDIFAPLLLGSDDADKAVHWGAQTPEAARADEQSPFAPMQVGLVERGAFLPSPVRLGSGDRLHPTHVEQAVFEAEHTFYSNGASRLANASASCWRDMRSGPTVQGLETCHAFDLAAADLVDDHPDFAPLIVQTRLRLHRDMLPVAVAGEVDGSERSAKVAALVSAMDTH